MSSSSVDASGALPPRLPSDLVSTDSLIDEGRLLARRVFGAELDDREASRYARAVGALHLDRDDPSGRHRIMLHRALAGHYDVESIEFALRLTNRKNPVSRRIQTLSFIIEGGARQSHRFLAEKPSPLSAVLALSVHGFRAAALYARGRYALWALRERTDV